MNCMICLKEVSSTANDILDKKNSSCYHKSCLKSLFGDSNIPHILDFSKKEFLTTIPEVKSKGMSISGVQPKLSAVIENKKVIITDKNGKYILKPAPEKYDDLCINEHLSMTIGNILGIETPPIGLLRFSDLEPVYIVKRFDRIKDDRIHVEDMTQIMALNRDSEGEYKYSKSYEEVVLKEHKPGLLKYYKFIDGIDRYKIITFRDLVFLIENQ